jgi:hypothetical protein
MAYGLDARGVMRFVGQKLAMEELEMFLPDPIWQQQSQQAMQVGPQLASDPMGMGPQQQQGPMGMKPRGGRGQSPAGPQAIQVGMNARQVSGMGGQMQGAA